MARPQMSEKFMINEGLDDAYAVEQPQVDNSVVVRVAELARNTSRETIEEDRKRFPGALLIARYSLGIRGIDPPEARPFEQDDLYVDTDEVDGWGESVSVENLDGVEAYNLEDLDEVFIGSGSSGAMITFEKITTQPSTWNAKFEEGKRGPSHMYKRIYRALGSEALFDDGFKKKIWASNDEFQEFIDTYEMD